ncbi:MAG: ImmA/IrrE family metallo-endopeptidase [Nitrospira sp.]|nr:ImmA/IrrE family metallo-endopeptidase [Nitrospira sp.]
MDGDRLRVLRLSRDMSLDDLADAAGAIVSKQMLSRYERGLSEPTPKVLTALAGALQIPVSRLLEAPKVMVRPVAYRKRASLSKGDQSRISSLLEINLQQRVRLQEANGFNPPSIPILSMGVDSIDAAETVAERIRRDWELGEAPIMSLVDELEGRLVHVLEVDAPETFDGLSLVAYDEKQRPIAVAAAIRRGVPGDRQRLSLAHELGHIILDLASTVDEEKAAYRFAGALLAPAVALRREVGERRSAIDLNELAMLKQRYRMSLQALVYRLKDIGIITENHAKDWFMRIRARGWAKVEPWEIGPEETTWLKRNVHRAVAEGVLRRDEAKEMLGEGASVSSGSSSERLDLMQMTRDERRRLLEQSVAESISDYELDPEWIDSFNEEGSTLDAG